MTDKQLALLLNKYTTILELEIVKLRQVLSDDLERHERPRMGFEPGDFTVRMEPTGDFVCLDGLNGLFVELRSDIARLRGYSAYRGVPGKGVEYEVER